MPPSTLRRRSTDREIWKRRTDADTPVFPAPFSDEDTADAGLARPLPLRLAGTGDSDPVFAGVGAGAGAGPAAGAGIGAVADECNALLIFSSFSFLAAARRFSSRNSAPGDVALTNGTPAPPAPLPFPLAPPIPRPAKGFLPAPLETFKLLTDLGVFKTLPGGGIAGEELLDS